MVKIKALSFTAYVVSMKKEFWEAVRITVQEILSIRLELNVFSTSKEGSRLNMEKDG